MKDRQSSKGQGGRTSSLDSESSPDSWHSTQVRVLERPPQLEGSPCWALCGQQVGWGSLQSLTLVGTLP